MFKNTLLHISLSALLCLVASMVSCSGDDHADGGYFDRQLTVYPHTVEVPFDVENTVLLTVHSPSVNWTYSCKELWIQIRRVDNTLYVTTKPHANADPRWAEIIFSEPTSEDFSVIIEQRAASTKIYTYDIDGIPATAISPNGRYLVGSVGGEPYDVHTGFFWDMESGGEPVYFDYSGYFYFNAVSNTGVAVGCMNGLPAAYDHSTGEIYNLELDFPDIRLEESTTGEYYGEARDISENGTLIVGHCAVDNDNRWEHVPLKWILGNCHLIPSPEEDHIGERVSLGYQAIGVCGDGEKIVGWQIDSNREPQGCLWTPDFWFFGKELMEYYWIDEQERYYSNIVYTPTYISNNGRYVTGNFIRADDQDDPLLRNYYSFRFDTQNESFRIFRDDSQIYGSPVFCTDDGTVFFRSHIYNGTVGYSELAAYMWKQHSVSLPANTIAAAASADGRIIVGNQHGGKIQVQIIKIIE